MAGEDRVYIKVSPENVFSIGLMSMVALFGLVMGKQIIRGIRRVTGDTVDHDPPKRQGGADGGQMQNSEDDNA